MAATRKALATLTGLLLTGSLTACATFAATAIPENTPSATSSAAPTAVATSKTTTTATTSRTSASVSPSGVSYPSIPEAAKAQLDSLMAKAGCSDQTFQDANMPYTTGSAICTDTVTAVPYIVLVVEAGHIDDTVNALAEAFSLQLNKRQAVGYVDGGTWLVVIAPTRASADPLADAEALAKKIGMGKALVKQ